MFVLSGVTGSAKLARLNRLKISARNCTLKFSEILRIGLFLKNERSRFTRPGPGMMFRPEFPLKFKHCRSFESPTAFLPKTGSELHIGVGPLNNDAGADGIAKQSVLI